ncbi:WD40 repeat domain-containing protein [Nonomuraea sp. NPDC046802]|uniref:WD40 repeat domain-containing protein n=1 Tax=Nonomuraea sp. NPDC046802 TaxID=3154919 RepID=UPI0033E29F8A
MNDPHLNALKARIADTSVLFGARRRKRAATRLAALGSPASMAMLAEAFTATADQQVADIAAHALEAVQDQKLIDAVAEVVFSTGDERLAAMITRDGGNASDPGRQAMSLFLAGDFERYAELDFDGSLLRAVRAEAGEKLRRRLADKARAAGRVEWVRVVAGGRRESMSAAEWESAAGILEGAKRWEELWRLALEAPAIWAARMLRAVGNGGWRPTGDSDRAGLTELVQRASAACAAKVPATTVFGGSEAQVIRAGTQIHSLAVSPDSTLLFSGGYLSDLRSWEVHSGDPVGVLPGGKDVLTMTTTPDGKMLITGDKGGRVKLWRLPSGTMVDSYVQPGARRLLALALPPAGDLLATGGYGKRVQLWHLSSGTLARAVTLEADRVWVPCLATSRDGKMLISGGQSGRVRLWHLPTGAPIGDLMGHSDHVSCLAITPDGALLASGSYDNSIRLWHLPSGSPAGVLSGHTGSILSLAITPDGKLLVSAGKDRVVRMWHLPSGAPAGELRGHQGQIECLAVSPDGLLLASGAVSGEMRWWRRRLSKIETLVNTPVGQLTPAHVRKTEVSSKRFSADERAWLDLVAALVRWRHRHDVELVDPSRGAPEARDIELIDDASALRPEEKTLRQDQPRKKRNSKRGRKGR